MTGPASTPVKERAKVCPTDNPGTLPGSRLTPGGLRAERRRVLPKHIAANLDVTERAKGWWSMRCPTGRHGAPLRFHAGDRAHITYADLGKCPESETYRWLISRHPSRMPQEAERRPQAKRPRVQAARTGSCGRHP